MREAQNIRVGLPDGSTTYTVIDGTGRAIGPIEDWLEFGRACDHSPNTAKAYALSLRLWWNWLALIEKDWRDVGLDDFGGFIQWLRTGDSPKTRQLVAQGKQPAPATLHQRLAAVVSFYKHHQADAEVGPRLTREVAHPLAHGQFKPFLVHVSRRRGGERNAVRVRRRGQHRVPPVLLPDQIEAILDDCATWHNGFWKGDLRYRLLFETMASSGVRIGEALGLRHRDWHTSRGDTPFIEIQPREDHAHGVRQKSGFRKVYVSDEADRLYKEHLFELCELGLPDAYSDADDAPVFVNLVGPTALQPLRPSSVYDKFSRLKHRLASVVPAEMTPHWFRHTHATAALMAGVEPLIVSRRLGHSSVQTTLDLYGWVVDDRELQKLADWRALARAWGADL